MKLLNIHSRKIKSDLRKAGSLINDLANADSKLWPSTLWPRSNFDRKQLEIGAIGGHGGTKYIVEKFIPGLEVKFEFIQPKNYYGYHKFFIKEICPQFIEIFHETSIDLSGFDLLIWKISIEWVHNELIEDAFDCAELYLTGKIFRKNRWPLYVYILRHIIGGSRLLIEFFKLPFQK